MRQEHTARAEEIDPQIVGYFEQGVLAFYQSQPDKFAVETDNFEGRVQTTEAYAAALDETGKEGEYVSVRFGYRTLSEGSLAVAAYLPDLLRAQGKAHVSRWTGFALTDAEWMPEPDERFNLWVARYLEGSWEVDSGPRRTLEHLVQAICSLTHEVLGLPLFQTAGASGVRFPLAQNTHSYGEAHERLYGYLIDGLDKQCIRKIAARSGQPARIASEKTVRALRSVLPLRDKSPLWTALDRISEQRRQSAHGVRRQAESYGAFEAFNADLETCVAGLQELLLCLEGLLGMNAERAQEREVGKQGLPVIVRASDPFYSICSIKAVVGKTVERVEYGFRADIERVHGSEAILLHFTDGSILSIDTGSNAANVADQHGGWRPEDFHVDFVLNWVPPP